MTLKEVYWKVRAWLSAWISYLKFKATGEDEVERAKRKTIKCIKKEFEKQTKMKIKLDHERCRREVQAEITRSLEEDEISALLSNEVYEGFEAWLRAERQKERNAKKTKQPLEHKQGTN